MAGLDYLEVEFDQVRRLRYRVRDLRDLCLALDNITLLQLLQRLAGIDLNALYTTVRFGLLHEAPKLTQRQVEGYIDAHLDKFGNLSRITDAIAQLINATGLISPERGDASGEAKAS